MAQFNKTTPQDNSNVNDVLNAIIAEHDGPVTYDYNYGGETLLQRYVTNVINRQPRTLFLTALPMITFFVVLPLILSSTNHDSKKTITKSNLATSVNNESTSGEDAALLPKTGDNESAEVQDTTSPINPTTPGVIAKPTTSPIRITNPGSTSPLRVQPTPPSKPLPTPIVVPTPIVIPKPTPIPTPIPTPTPPPKPLKVGILCFIKDGGLNEASGLVASAKHANIVYTHNDEIGPLYAIDTNTCKVVGKFSVNNLRSDPDPEAITIDRTTGNVWFGDIGNGHPGQPSSMTDKTPKLKYPSLPARIVIFKEPTKLSGSVSTQAVDITYQGGNQNSEALLANPKTGQGYIISKNANSKVFRLPHPLKSGQAADTGVRIPGWVSDATFTNNGNWVLVRYRTATDAAPTNVFVYDAKTWKLVDKIQVPKVAQGESIAAERNGTAFIIGSEGTSSPLARINLPAKYAGN